MLFRYSINSTSFFGGAPIKPHILLENSWKCTKFPLNKPQLPRAEDKNPKKVQFREAILFDKIVFASRTKINDF